MHAESGGRLDPTVLKGEVEALAVPLLDSIVQAGEGALVEGEAVAVLSVCAPEEGEHPPVDPCAVAGRHLIQKDADLMGEHRLPVLRGEVGEAGVLGQDHGVHVRVEEQADRGWAQAGLQQPLARLDHRLEAGREAGLTERIRV